MGTVEWVVPLFFYLIGYTIAFRRIAGQLAWHSYHAQQKAYRVLYEDKVVPGGEQWFGSIVASLILSVVWPVSLPVAYGLAAAQLGTGIFYTPRSDRERLQQQRIRELEKAAGLR